MSPRRDDASLNSAHLGEVTGARVAGPVAVCWDVRRRPGGRGVGRRKHKLIYNRL